MPSPRTTARTDYSTRLRRKATLQESFCRRLEELEPEDAHEIAKTLIEAFPEPKKGVGE